MHVFLPVYLLSLVIRQILLLWALQKRLSLARCCSLIEVHNLATCAATASFWVEPCGFHSLFTLDQGFVQWLQFEEVHVSAPTDCPSVEAADSGKLQTPSNLLSFVP